MKKELLNTIDFIERLSKYGNRSDFLKAIAENEDNDPNYTSNLLNALSKKLTFLQDDLRTRTNGWIKGLTANWQEDDKNLYHFSSGKEFLELYNMINANPKQITSEREEMFNKLNDVHKETITKAYFELKK